MSGMFPSEYQPDEEPADDFPARDGAGDEWVTVRLGLPRWKWDQIIRSLHSNLHFELAGFIEEVIS